MSNAVQSTPTPAPMSDTETVLRDVIDSDPYHRQFTPLLTIIDGLRAERGIPVAALRWVGDGDTGASSLALWSHMATGAGGDARYPRDASDFGRCQRLLDRAPAWRARIGEMTQYGPEWAALAERWDALEAAFNNLHSGALSVGTLIYQILDDVTEAQRALRQRTVMR